MAFHPDHGNGAFGCALGTEMGSGITQTLLAPCGGMGNDGSWPGYPTQ